MHPTLRLAPCLLVPALLLICSPALAKELPARPNIILIFSDDHGFADLGCQGLRDDVKTPHLDRLARDGVRCTHGYVTAPQCVPSRAGLLTGRYQVRFGLETNLEGPLPPEEKTIAERLKKAGYVTGMVGKWHLNKVERRKPGARPPPRRFQLDDPSMPHHQGFDEYLCGPRTVYVASHTPQGKPLPRAPAFLRDDRFRIDVQSEAAVSFIDRHAREPFFLYLPYFAPHVPLEAPAKYLDRFPGVKDEKRKTALAMIAAMDDGVGAIVKKLREHGIEKKTLIVFISDNGAPLRKAAWNGSLNEPLVGEKGMLTDGGIRVPFLMSWPGVLPAGKVVEAPVIALDVAATAVALAGLPADADLDGVNLMPFLLGERKSAPYQTLYWRWRSQAAVREGKWKLVLFGTEHRLLFDLESPEGEKQDVRAKHPEVADGLQKKLETWAATLKPPGLPKTVVPADQRFFDDHLKADETEAKRREPAKIHVAVAGRAVTLNGTDLTFPVGRERLVGILGKPTREARLANTVLTWDELGLFAYERPGTGKVMTLTIALDRGGARFWPAGRFAGTLEVDGARIRAESKVDAINDQKKGEPFRKDRLLPDTWALRPPGLTLYLNLIDTGGRGVQDRFSDLQIIGTNKK